jgi:hypothetical protein
LAFRGPITNEDYSDPGSSPPAPVHALENVGYQRERVQKLEFGGQTAYLIQMVRR